MSARCRKDNAGKCASVCRSASPHPEYAACKKLHTVMGQPLEVDANAKIGLGRPIYLIRRLTLPLFVARVGAYHDYSAMSPNNFAVFTNAFYACPDFHGCTKP